MDERFMEAASAIELMHRNAAIAAVTQAPPETDPRFDGTHCVEDDCGDEIPEARRRLGKIRCLACQARRETRRAS